MIEDFRLDMYQKDLLEPPPSERAFGVLSYRASRGGWIERIGIAKVKNKKAHNANASIWRKL
jgi:hypothetical protein